MRYNYRVKIAEFTFFAMIAKTQTLEGVTSLQKDSTHIPMLGFRKLYIATSRRNLAQNPEEILFKQHLFEF